MPQSERAKQFMPFDALKGLQNALRMKEYQHERVEKVDIDQETIDKMTKILINLKSGEIVTVKYYEDGHYKNIIGKCKILYEEKTIVIDNKRINLDDVFDIDKINN